MGGEPEEEEEELLDEVGRRPFGGHGARHGCSRCGSEGTGPSELV